MLQPERRLFTVQRRQVAETAIQTNLLRDFYATLGEGDPKQGWVIRLYLNPLAPWIWLGAALVRAAAASSRCRTGACASARRRVAARPAASRPNSMRRLLFILPLLTLALMAGFFAWSLTSGRDPASIGSVVVGRPAPKLDLPALRPGEPPLTDATCAPASR